MCSANSGNGFLDEPEGGLSVLDCYLLPCIVELKICFQILRDAFLKSLMYVLIATPKSSYCIVV